MNGELDKKLAEHFGLEYIVDGQVTWIRNPNTGQWQKNWFTESLDACFRWVVPEAIKRFGETIMANLLAQWAEGIAYGKHNRREALVLSLGIGKLIDSGMIDDG